MAKAASKNAKVKDLKASAEAKNCTKVIRAVRSPKTGAYTFKEAIVHKDKIKEFHGEKNKWIVSTILKAVLSARTAFCILYLYKYSSMGFFEKLFGKKEKESLDQGLQKTKEGFLSRISKAHSRQKYRG